MKINSRGFSHSNSYTPSRYSVQVYLYAIAMDEASMSPLEVIQSHLEALMGALKCPACGEPFGTKPYKSASCGHTLCFKCGELVLSTLGKCPVKHPPCGMHIIPKDLQLDRQVRDLVNTTRKFQETLYSTGTTTRAGETNTATPSIGNTKTTGNTTKQPIIDNNIRKRVCVTSIEDIKSKQRIYRSLRGLNADIRAFDDNLRYHNNGGTGIANLPEVVVTPLDGSTREFLSRSRSIHYALAYALPIVDVSWVSASSVRREWLPTRPYECSLPPRPRSAIFEGCVFHLDCNSPETSKVLVGDVRRWLEAAGASFYFNGNDNVRMYVRVVPDINNNDDDIEERMWSEEVMEQCDKHDIAPQTQDIPWISDCLISQACPPAVNVLETMAETMADTFTCHDSEWMEDDAE